MKNTTSEIIGQSDGPTDILVPGSNFIVPVIVAVIIAVAVIGFMLYRRKK
ncbi:hypothetical protein [Enterococcus canintestini]|nr:hypothetical protein [Enterococcus canintestini]MDT2740045.1 hypothetical protein [Enterococcus canintestini]